jgi:predicted site-specific integrase-resolvase
MNLNRKGLRTLIDKAIKGEIKEVIIVHKDRLCRFGYELIEDIITKYSNVNIINASILKIILLLSEIIIEFS